MKEEIYSWMKNLAVYYIFLTAVMNFIPDEKYARYIRYFTGILLILLLCSPILQLFQLDGSLMDNFNGQLRQAQGEVPYVGEEGQEKYLVPAYEKEMEVQIVSYLNEMGMVPQQVNVVMDYQNPVIQRVEIYLGEPKEEKKEEEIADGLEDKYQIRREALSFFYSEHGEAAVADPSAGGDIAGGDRSANGEDGRGGNGIPREP